jgi:hypothetical protein
MNQLDAVGVDDAQQGGLGQETMAPVLVSTQQPEEAGAVGQLGKQGQMIVGQPAVESPVTHPFNGVEQTNSSDLARGKISLRVYGQVSHLVIYFTKQLSDKILGSHTALLWSGLGTNTMGEPYDFFN